MLICVEEELETMKQIRQLKTLGHWKLIIVQNNRNVVKAQLTDYNKTITLNFEESTPENVFTPVMSSSVPRRMQEYVSKNKFFIYLLVDKLNMKEQFKVTHRPPYLTAELNKQIKHLDKKFGIK